MVTNQRLEQALRLCKAKKKQGAGVLYLIQSGQFFKIGITNNLHKRLQQYRMHNPHEVKVVAERQVNGRKRLENLERRAINHFLRYHHSGEWFCLPQDKLDELIVRYYSPQPDFCQDSHSSINSMSV